MFRNAVSETYIILDFFFWGGLLVENICNSAIPEAMKLTHPSPVWYELKRYITLVK